VILGHYNKEKSVNQVFFFINVRLEHIQAHVSAVCGLHCK